ncbi:hypothetical protein Golomagni_02526 [Golovinomyces magnicellulatus]|nr:hypothetical protein Golomagni_02526 [Golovinomyces magnicellulatus]
MASQHDRASPIQEDANLCNRDHATIAKEDQCREKSCDKDDCESHSELKTSKNESGTGEKCLHIPTKDQPLKISTKKLNNNEEKDQRMSPKKKRSRDQIEEAKERYDHCLESSDTSKKVAVSCHLATRSEPEKKRPRDMEPGHEPSSNEGAPIQSEAKISTNSSENKLEQASTEKESVPLSGSSDKPKESTVTFASSGFASLASLKTSPFGSLGVNKPSIFSEGLSKRSESKFSTLSSDLKTPGAIKSHGSSSIQNSSSAFGAIGEAKLGINCLAGESTFGSKTINAFTYTGGSKLSSFATPGTENYLLTAKPTKAFGAPDSEDDYSNSDAEEADHNKHTNSSENEDNSKSGHDEKKKSKIVKIDDGETGEVTLLQIRAKLFALKSTSVGWKERGVGTLKINVPKSCVSYHENGLPISGSFSRPNIDNKKNETNPGVARLIMRQENTHRVVLNTIILREMNFEEKPSVSMTQLVFTAFEGETELKPIKLLLKMTDTNSKFFMAEIESIKRELEPGS